MAPDSTGTVTQWRMVFYNRTESFPGIKAILLHTRIRPPASLASREARRVALRHLPVSKKRQRNNRLRWERDIPVPCLPWRVLPAKDTDSLPIFKHAEHPIFVLNMSHLTTYSRGSLISLYVYLHRVRDHQVKILPFPCIHLGIS